MCGPYSALSKFKYKVKLTPGSQKKGKATKQCMEIFSKMKDVTQKEKDALREITDAVLTATIIGGVKISTPGLQKIMQGKKKSKKGKGKGR